VCSTLSFVTPPPFDAVFGAAAVGFSLYSGINNIRHHRWGAAAGDFLSAIPGAGSLGRGYRAFRAGRRAFRAGRTLQRWTDIGAAMPKSVGPIGFPMVLHPRDPDTLWVFPMDGSDVWPRISPGGKPAVYRSVNGGKTWQRQATGLPKTQAWWTVKRQAMTADQAPTVGVYFGTTSGEIWGSRDEGRSWKCLTAHLPHIYAIECA